MVNGSGELGELMVESQVGRLVGSPVVSLIDVHVVVVTTICLRISFLMTVLLIITSYWDSSNQAAGSLYLTR